MLYGPFTDALKAFFARAKWEGQSVPSVFAGPDRAFQELKRRHPKLVSNATSRVTGRRGVTGQALGDKPSWVPYFSILVSPKTFDPSRFNPRSFRGITKNLQTGGATTMRYPRPVNADVTVELWCGTVGGWSIASHVAAQMELEFLAESAYLHLDWSLPRYYKPPFNTLEHARQYGKTRCRLINQGWQDNSDLEALDGPKQVRWTWSGRLEGYLPYRLEEARIVREFTIEIVDEDTLEVLDTVIGGVED